MIQSNRYKQFSWNNFKNDVYITLIFGTLSGLLGFVKFYIPGIDGASSDFRELALLIGIIHLKNPLFSIGLSGLTLISLTPDGSYISTFFMHAIPLIVTWFIFYYLKLKKFDNLKTGLLCSVSIILYYTILLIPIFIASNFIIGINTNYNFFEFYYQLLSAILFEMAAIVAAVSVYFVQYKLQSELQVHKQNLVKVVNERTDHLEQVIEELKTTQKYLIQSEKMAAIGTLSSGIAHEINNPLNYISGGATVIEQLKPNLEPTLSPENNIQLSEGLQLINEGLSQAIYVIQALMTFSRNGESKLELYDINQIIENTLLFMHASMPKEIKIVKNYLLTQKTPLYIEKIHQVFLNIFNNAFYELENSRILKPELNISTDINSTNAVIKIKNNGNKISESDLGKIFDPFFTTKAPDNGTGLGLSICYNVIKEHKGSIFAENTENGVCFTIILPVENA